MIQPRNSAQIRRNNLRTLLCSIKQYGPISKRDLQNRTGLSWGAVSSLTGLLHERGYIVYTGKQVTSVGRKPDELDINGSDHYIVGIDLNLSGICGVVTDMKGRIIQEWRRLLAVRDYGCVMDTLLSLLDEILYKAYPQKQIMGIGLAVQGFVNVEKGVSHYFPHVKNWRDVPLKKLLEDRYGYTTLLMHDPDCIMITERAFGHSGMNLSNHGILVRMDSSIGMSMLLNGELYMGATGQSGELGHISVNRDGPLCTCGSRGCLEEYASGNGLVRRFVELVNQGRSTSVDIRPGEGISYKVLGDAALAGDRLCLDLFRQMGRYLGEALGMVCNLLNPELVVLYGDMMAYRGVFCDVAQKHMEERLYTGIPVKLEFSDLGYNAAAQGVALVVSERTMERIEPPSEMEELPEESVSCGHFLPGCDSFLP